MSLAARWQAMARHTKAYLALEAIDKTAADYWATEPTLTLAERTAAMEDQLNAKAAEQEQQS